MDDVRVGVARMREPRYPPAPFHPTERYPELDVPVASGDNLVYRAVRTALSLAGLDENRFGETDWNPLGEVLAESQLVLVKPNFIRQSNLRNPSSYDEVITHGAVLRAVLDYVVKAMGQGGRVVLADAPEGSSIWDLIVERSGVAELVTFYEKTFGVKMELIDLRRESYRERAGVPYQRIAMPGDPAGSTQVNLGPRSAFAGLSGRRYYGADYDVRETNDHHRGTRHEYLFSRSALMADCIIHVPKLKTHKKCGTTLSLKGLVGLNTHKNWLPHFSMGAPSTGGDQYRQWTAKGLLEYTALRVWKPIILRVPSLGRLGHVGKTAGEAVFGTTSETVRSGNWYGNDTVWRMILDLARIATYARPDGTVADQPQRKSFTVVDGIIGGEGEGPLAPRPRRAGLVCAGPPMEADLVATRLMGFDHDKIPYLLHALRDPHPLPLGRVRSISDIHVRSTESEWDGPLSEIRAEDTLRFEPHFGWAGHIELDGRRR